MDLLGKQVVSENDLDARLRTLRESVLDPAHGIYGPGSVSWNWNRELANFLAAGRAALLQLAHPPVAQAIWDHSRALEDARGRFRRTFENVFAMSFGDWDSAVAAARRVHAVHQGIRGTFDETVGDYRAGASYSANQAPSLFWVHATLVDSVAVVRRLCLGSFEQSEWHTYYRQSLRFMNFFGVAEEALPDTPQAFADYVRAREESGFLGVGRNARAIADALLSDPHPLLGIPADVYRRLTAALIGPRWAKAFGLPPPLAAPLVRLLGAVCAGLPRALRFAPAYWSGLHRTGHNVSRVTLAASDRFRQAVGLPALSRP